MEIIEQTNNDICIFKLTGRLDSNTSPRLEEKVLNAIEHGSTKIVMDCGGLDYISSAGLRILNMAIKKLKPKEGKIVLCAMQDYIREVFEIAGFDSFIPIVSSCDEALMRF